MGAMLCRKFLEAGDRVVVYDAFRSYLSPLIDQNYSLYFKKRYEGLENKVEVVHGDVRDYVLLNDSVRNAKPDRIIHAAAFPIADLSDKYPHEAVAVTYNGAHNILEASKNLGLKRFVLISSSMIYGDFKYKPCDESHSTEPKGIYGSTKLGSEILTKTYSRRYKFSYAIVRPSAIYGPTDCNRRVTQLFLENAIKGEPIVLHGGGKSELDFTFVDDAAQGIFLATKEEKGANETFNITYGQGRTLEELAEIVKQHFPKTKIVYKEIPEGEQRPSRGALDISRARNLLGYKPRYSLEEGINRYVDFLKDIHSLNDS
ncbi:MAG: 3-beta hydroxysteroid dehydrogenase/isomerase family protein [Parcubacteria group bacterium GW2011_GWA2_42_14]|nr:MAG: 3-beta hydroxysteroid dehydrogenase/isomerase family protein [Parcubacteria group bacterium GW2011_GWA2_42_14]